jgi:hypothetical protein
MPVACFHRDLTHDLSVTVSALDATPASTEPLPASTQSEKAKHRNTAALSGLAENSAFPISSIVNLLLKIWFATVSLVRSRLWGITGSGKKLCNGSFAILALSWMTSPPCPFMDVILPKLDLLPGSRY